LDLQGIIRGQFIEDFLDGPLVPRSFKLCRQDDRVCSGLPQS
jgi:hypothetical protein